MRFLPALLAIMSLAATLLAQEAPLVPHAPTLAWQRFQEQNAGHWQVKWHPATATPAAIYGAGLTLGGPVEEMEGARAEAAKLLAARAGLLGTGKSEWIETIAAKANMTWILVYDQTFAGMPVIGGRADVRINEIGVVSMFGSIAVDIPATFNPRPVVPAAVATELAATAQLGRAAVRPPAVPRLVVWADTATKAPATPVLAWEVQIDERPAELIVAKVYVNAWTAAVLERKSEVHYCYGCDARHVSSAGPDRHEKDRHSRRMQRSMELIGEATTGGAPLVAPSATQPPFANITGTVRAWTNTGLAANSPLTNVPLANVRVTSTAGTTHTDANGNFSITHAGTAPVLVSATLEGQHSRRVRVAQGTQMTASQQITPGTPGTLQFGSQNMGSLDWSQTTTYYWANAVNEYTRALMPASLPTVALMSQVNPQVNIASSCNAYYTSRTINFYHESSSCNNTAFSTVVIHEWGHGLDDVFGGISNQQGDGLSEAWGDVLAIYQTRSAIVGQFFRKNGGYIRDATNTRTWPSSSPEVHAAGEIFMGWAWDLRSNLMSVHGSVLGHSTAERIVIPSIAANARNQPDAVREVFIIDDNDGNLNNGTPNYASLEKASIKRNLPFPKIQAGSIAHTALSGTEEALTPRIVRALVTPLIGSFNKVELVYDNGTGTQRREMVPSGSANEYIALLPGQASPATTSYRIEATHSTNLVLRLPESTDFSYGVGRHTAIFQDDFEGGNKGWTHGLLAGQDDWQWGSPNGASGTSQGVAWSDPSSAVSGTRCWANDLGGPGFNGAYQGNTHNYLRSPLFSTAGRTGVTLRFKRWLTVEEAQYDQARILVNGAAVWTNPSVGHTLDKAWTDFELPIPSADNKPSVQLDWRLQSDGGMHLGGWNVDDVEIFTFAATPLPPVQFVVSPEQVGLGKNSSATLKGTPNAPTMILLSMTKGPLHVPGLPTIFVSGSFISIGGAAFDAQGQMGFNFTAPTSPSATGLLTYGQALELANGQVNGSNGIIVLFGK